VQVGGRGRAAGQDEALQRLQSRIHLVARLLEPLDQRGRHAQAVGARTAEVCAHVEQLVLDAAQLVGMLGRQVGQREQDADVAVELVDRAIGLDPRMGLGHPAHVAQVRLALVAELRVDAGQVHRHRTSKI